MIIVSKPKAAPKRLAAGLAEIAELEAAMAADPATAGYEDKPFVFAKGIYGTKAVKRVLSQAHHAKCCFCEGTFTAQYPGDVEHFRPKTFVHQDRKSTKHYPGYYWLAYDWANLYFSCSTCNTAKGNQFPLVDQATRARRPVDPIGNEQPLLLDPGGPVDPRNHIRFVQSLATGSTPAGLVTIDVADLNRASLQAERSMTFKLALYLKTIASRPDVEMANAELIAIRQEARDRLAIMASPSAPYSAMIQDNL